MAEKEERILIKNQINYHPPYGGWCGEGKEIVLPRQDIIDIIAKALCQIDGWPCKECRYEKDNASCQTCLEVELYKQYAEAALDALLGETK